jgi:hypothetical protein
MKAIHSKQWILIAICILGLIGASVAQKAVYACEADDRVDIEEVRNEQHLLKWDYII